MRQDAPRAPAAVLDLLETLDRSGLSLLGQIAVTAHVVGRLTAVALRTGTPNASVTAISGRNFACGASQAEDVITRELKRRSH